MRQKDLKAGEDYAYDRRWHGVQRVRVVDADTTREVKVKPGFYSSIGRTKKLVGALVQTIDQQTNQPVGEPFMVERNSMRLLVSTWADYVAKEEAERATIRRRETARKHRTDNCAALRDALAARGIEASFDAWGAHALTLRHGTFPALAELLGVTLPHSNVEEGL